MWLLLQPAGSRSTPARMPRFCSGTTRCSVPVLPRLLLLLVALAASNVLFAFPATRRVAWFSSRTPPPLRCDIFRGEWVPDPSAPSYTNATCPAIHEQYDCMRFGKPDLGFAKWRWRPDGCELPRFDGARFLSLMAGKSIAFVGDSLARNHKDSLVCLLARAAEPRMHWPSFGQTAYHYHYAGHNVTVANFWAPFLVRHEQVDEDAPADTAVWNLYLDEPDGVWAAHVAGFDYVVVSAANWFYRPSMLYEAGGRLVGCHGCRLPNVTDLTPRYALRMATRAALRALSGADGRWPFRGTAVLRTVSPSHYEGGEWNKGGDCVRTRPQRRGEGRLEGLEPDFHRLQLEEFMAAEGVARDVGDGVRMMLMDTTEAMVLRADAHPGQYRAWTPTHYNDCLHSCLPGAIDTWNDMLLHMLS